jgi:hypothetical protein
MEKETLNESTLDPIQKTRCKDLFIGPEYETIKSSVKSQILDNLYNWLKKMGYDYEQVITSVRIEGSSIGFQYTPTSDIDVSIISSIPDNEIDKLWKLLPNGQCVKGTEMPINYYMLRSNETDTDKATTDIYDLLNDKFTKQTPLEEIKREIPYSYVIEVAKFFTAGIDDRINELEADKTELEFLKKLTDKEIKEEEKKDLIARKETEIKADLDSIYVAHCMLKSLRHQAYGKKGEGDGWYPIPIILELKDTEKFDDPNHSISNLVYKMIEQLGYFKKLEELEKEREKLAK